MAWIEPVFDRTQLDIDNQTRKGWRGAEDLNRVEGNCAVLARMLGMALETKGWSRRDLPGGREYARIRDNVEAIRRTAGVYPNTPQPPSAPLNTWQKWNDLERILADARRKQMEVVSRLIYTGECYAGERIGVM